MCLVRALRPCAAMLRGYRISHPLSAIPSCAARCRSVVTSSYQMQPRGATAGVVLHVSNLRGPGQTGNGLGKGGCSCACAT